MNMKKKILIQRSIIIAFPSGGSHKLSGPADLESDPVAGWAHETNAFSISAPQLPRQNSILPSR